MLRGAPAVAGSRRPVVDGPGNGDGRAAGRDAVAGSAGDDDVDDDVFMTNDGQKTKIKETKRENSNFAK